jgi:hypothetical protein
MAETERQTQLAAAIQAEKKALALRMSGLEVELRSTAEELVTARAERDSVTIKLTDTRGANRRLRQSIDKVRAVAADSAGELADLRLQSRDLQARVQTLQEIESTLRSEHGDLSTELARVRDELVRTRAVARTFRDGGRADASAIDLGGSQLLESQLAELREENLALERRLAAGFSSGGALPAQKGPAPGAVYQNDPAGLLAEFGALANARYQRALQGQVAWDFFDLAIAGAVVPPLLPLLLFVWILVRRARWRKTVKSLQSRAVRRGGEQASRVLPAAAPSATGRRYRPARRGGFSAVISSQPTDIRAEVPAEAAFPIGEADSLAGVLGESPEKFPPQAGRAGSDQESSASEPRKVIGARVWMEDIDENDAEEEEEDMACTQVIPKLSMEDLAAHSTPEAEPPDAASGADSPSADDDKDLLSELKSVINKKFDELLKP